MTLDELIEKLNEMREQYGGHYKVEVTQDGYHIIDVVKESMAIVIETR